jgi:hypothetical protein
MRGPVSGSIALALATLAYGLVLGRLRRHENEHQGAPGRWWGYVRDGANIAGAALFFAGCWLGGFAGPHALVLGVALLLATYGLDWLLGKHLALGAARWIVPLVMAAVGIAGIVARPVTERVLEQLLAIAAPHPVR